MREVRYHNGKEASVSIEWGEICRLGEELSASQWMCSVKSDRQTVSQSVSQSDRQSVNQSDSRSFSQSVSHSVRQSVNQSDSQPVRSSDWRRKCTTSPKTRRHIPGYANLQQHRCRRVDHKSHDIAQDIKPGCWVRNSTHTHTHFFIPSKLQAKFRDGDQNWTRTLTLHVTYTFVGPVAQSL
jgi:hypothetical protein